jgi:Tol biopolymer transport system component
MRNRLGWVGVLLLALVLAGVSSQDDGKAQLEKAKYLLETKGDIEGTLKLLNSIVAASPQVRETAALAQYYIGVCYEKQKAQAARKAFQDVIDRFPEQSEAVKLAKERLAALASPGRPVAQASDELRIRKIWGSGAETVGAVSPDGKQWAYSKDGAGDLYVRDLSTMSDRRLTSDATYEKPAQFAGESVWSKDSKKIAYSWYNKDGGLDLRIVDLETGFSRILFNQKGRSVVLYDWSWDGRSILALVTDRESQGLSLISTKNGVEKVLKGLPPRTRGPRTVMHAFFSPDDRFVAFDHNNESDLFNREISVLEIANSREFPIVRHPAEDALFGWPREGACLIMTSNRSGANGLYSLKWNPAAAAEEPALLRPGVGRIIANGMTSQGSLFYSLFSIRQDVVAAEVDLETGQVISPPKTIVQSFEGQNSTSELSPDGKKVAFLSTRADAFGSLVDSDTIVVHHFETGKSQAFSVDCKISNFTPLRWSSDSESVLFMSRNAGGESVYKKLATESSKVEAVFPCGKGYFPLISSSGNVVFGYADNNSRSPEFIRLETAGSARSTIWPGPARAVFMSLSPDEKYVAFVTSEEALRTLHLVPSMGGQPISLWSEAFDKKNENEVFFHTGWSSDSRSVFVAKRDAGGRMHLWRVPIDGGAPVKTGISGNRISSFAYDLPTRKLVYTSGDFPVSEIWAIENFLPKK